MSLKANDLKNLVKKVFEIDSFKSKIGDDTDIVVLSFSVDTQEAAKDLENFIEMGYNFVLDADVTAGETDDSSYRVYVEIERDRHIGEHISDIVEGVKQLTGLEELRFRYFKSFKSQSATLENLEAAVPKDKNSYKIATERRLMDNFTNFFSNSYADNLSVLDESITFQRTFSGPVTFEIVNSGSKQEVYGSIKGPIFLENKDMAEVMFLTKVIGNYNINKLGNIFVFENNGWAVELERK